MSSTDRITGNYKLETLEGACGEGDITITAACGTGRIVLNGNLVVIGTTTNIASTTTIVNDSFIRVSTKSAPQGAGDPTGASEPVTYAGIQVERGDESTLDLRWNENVARWEYTDDASNYYPIMGRVKQDLNPVLGGDLKTSSVDYGCKEIQSDYPCNIVLNPGIDTRTTRGAVEIKEVSPNEKPPYNPGSVTIYAKPMVGSGHTGLHVRTRTREEQLVTKRYATLLALVL